MGGCGRVAARAAAPSSRASAGGGGKRKVGGRVFFFSGEDLVWGGSLFYSLVERIFQLIFFIKRPFDSIDRTSDISIYVKSFK